MNLHINLAIKVRGNDKRAVHEAIGRALLQLRLNHYGDEPLTVSRDLPIEINNGAAQASVAITVENLT